jgi:hypothetical protein
MPCRSTVVNEILVIMKLTLARLFALIALARCSGGQGTKADIQTAARTAVEKLDESWLRRLRNKGRANQVLRDLQESGWVSRTGHHVRVSPIYQVTEAGYTLISTMSYKGKKPGRQRHGT